ncbi:MAG: acylphosphatase [Natronospirillum sp.]
MHQRWHLLISGRVQGVFYRVSARDEALRLGLTGYVCNLPDGRVELCAEGDELALRSLLDWCWQGPEQAHISHIDQVQSPAAQEFDDFVVR